MWSMPFASIISISSHAYGRLRRPAQRARESRVASDVSSTGEAHPTIAARCHAPIAGCCLVRCAVAGRADSL